MISDPWRGLDELLPEGEAITIARSTGDVVDTLSRQGEDARQRMATRARDIVRADHTARTRADELLTALRQAAEPRARYSEGSAG